MSNRKPILFICTMFFILIGSQIVVSPLWSQMIKPRFKFQEIKEPEKEKKIPGQEPYSLEKKGLLEPTVQALEVAVDPDEYIVGPGDLFYINLWGEADLQIPALVTPEGKMIIETIGILDVDGKTLTQVQKLVQEQGNKKYKSAKITANLVQMRNIRVHVLGEVETPGTYLAQPVDRISVMIDRAGGITDWADERAIFIHHLDGNTDTFDLFEFNRKGQLDANIYVRGGDVIYVPPIKLSQKTVTIDGIMDNSGIYQIAEGETVEDFLMRVKALNRKVEVSDIYLIRNSKEGENSEIVKLNLFESQSGDNSVSNLTLQDGDIIYAPSIKDYVYVSGAVHLPGSYPFFVGFRAIDYVGMAGGTTQMGNIRGVRTIHAKTKKIEKGARVIVERGDTVVVPLSLRRKFTEYLQIVSGLTSLVLVFLAAQK